MRRENQGPFRDVDFSVLATTRYNRPGEGSWLLMLECGHEIRRKTSYPMPRRAHCRECGQIERNRNGGEVQ
jgi:hypothetical protein